VQCLESLLARPQFRQAAWKIPPLIHALVLSTSWVFTRLIAVIISLVDILKKNSGPQMNYQVGFCIWLLTFEQNIAEQINKCVLTSLT
jgi:V-type H+-transporting ATPase subunit H